MIAPITDPEIEKIAADLSEATTKRLRQYAADKREEALLLELQSSGKSDKEQVLEYLQRTERKSVATLYVSQSLLINTLRLKQAREELEAEGLIAVFTAGGVIRLSARGK